MSVGGGTGQATKPVQPPLGDAREPSARRRRRGLSETAQTTRAVYIALALIPLGLMFDFMDGKVARWRGKSSLMGQELDSLADLVSTECRKGVRVGEADRLHCRSPSVSRLLQPHSPLA